MADAGGDSDVDLMSRAATGDRDAFAALYRRHQSAIFRFARLMTGSSQMAEDVVQDVFLALMRRASGYDAARASLTTYLYGSARRHTRRRLLRERLFVAVDGRALDAGERTDGGEVAGELVRACEVRELRAAILTLPARYREVIVLCDLQDVSYAETATAIGCAVGTVRSRLHRARQFLARKMRRSAACTKVAQSSGAYLLDS
jgi:RNA polymerase sigma-70 factor (ECF subfamily)